ncbi:transcriptional regulator [Methylocystis sp. MitZ-2018]|nr:transcriptional regulator [Methylocystis sp. MitZ-2018]
MITGAQIRAARALLGWTVFELAKKARVGVTTVRRTELANGLTNVPSNDAIALRSALEKGGVEFIERNGGGPGVRLRVTEKSAPTIPIEKLNAENDE